MKLRRFAFLLVFAWEGLGLAAESKEDKMQTDQTQARYTRKSITYLGINVASGLSIDEEHLKIIEEGYRKQLELPRFDYNAVSLAGVYTIDQFVELLREYVKKVSFDRAAAEAEYEARFKSARVYMKDIERIMNSAYFYTLNVKTFKSGPWTCPENQGKAGALLNLFTFQCVPGTPGVMTELDVSATFYRANLTDPNKPPYELIKDVTWVKTMEFTPIIPPAPPAPGAGEALLEAFQRALAEFNASLPQRRHEASLANTMKCAKNQGEILARELKKVPDFQLLTPVTSALSDGVEFMLGTKEGLALDDTYEVGEFDISGKKSRIGFVKVRKVNDNTGSGEGTPSYAEKVKENRKFVGGELLAEWPMLKLDFGIAAVLQVVFTDLLNRLNDSGEKKMGFYPGAEIWAYKDMSNIFKLPEFYLGVDADFLLVASEEQYSVWLIHGMVGAEKKWFANSLIISAKLRAGISYYAISFEDGSSYEGDSIGFGADLGLSMQYYINPHFQPFLKVTGRFFTNPLDDTVFVDRPMEIGVMAAIGLNMEI